MTKEELKALLGQDEDGFLERKLAPHQSQVVESLVGFANTVPPGREAVLLIGQGPDKQVGGVPNADTLQRKIKQWADQCFPPIDVRPEILTTDAGSSVVAVLVPFSPRRPHFAGKAYKRVGSQTIEASAEMLDEMIAARNTKAGKLLAHKGETLSVDFEYRPFPPLGNSLWSGQESNGILFDTKDCTIESASAHSVELLVLGSGTVSSYELDRIVITKDVQNHRPIKLRVKLEV